MVVLVGHHSSVARSGVARCGDGGVRGPVAGEQRGAGVVVVGLGGGGGGGAGEACGQWRSLLDKLRSWAPQGAMADEGWFAGPKRQIGRAHV